MKLPEAIFSISTVAEGTLPPRLIGQGYLDGEFILFSGIISRDVINTSSLIDYYSTFIEEKCSIDRPLTKEEIDEVYNRVMNSVDDGSDWGKLHRTAKQLLIKIKRNQKLDDLL